MISSNMAASWFWSVAAVVTTIKVLLIPSYRSTDFEVHRNWLAITHSLPLNHWYYEETSEWTLDYPPFFALFEHVLSQVASLFDKNMLIVKNLNYASWGTILFQRLSVITTDFLFIYAAEQFCNHCLRKHKKTDDIYMTPAFCLGVLLVGNCGLLIVDHIHFQYNGFLFGILLLSVVRIAQGRNLEGALLFATLLNFKHIYLYIAPAYFVYLLRLYCFRSNSKDGSIIWTSFSVARLFTLGAIVVMVFCASFGPYICLGQLQQVLLRLFPFKRGLCHAYWAPNFWALYNVADKALSVVGVRAGLLPQTVLQSASMTGGLVQEFEHAVLPSVKPLATLVCTVLSILPCLVHMWRYPNGLLTFLRCLVLCGFGSYMFGWHVHEKAILIVLIPLSLLVTQKKKEAQVFLVLSTVGHFSLFPLIFTQAETPIKYCLMLFYTIFAFHSLQQIHGGRAGQLSLPLLNVAESLYLLGLIPLEIYCNGLHFVLGFQQRLPFLPLMLTSTYCALGVTYCWIRFYWLTLSDKSMNLLKRE